MRASSEPPDTAVVIPCFNEEARLDTEAFRSFVHRTPWVRFLFVNDGSSDGTGQLLARLAAELPGRVSCLELPQNRGKAEAVRMGIVHEMRAGAEHVGFWDADLATPLETITLFRDVLLHRERCLVVIGSRIRLLGHVIQRRWSRQTAGRAFAAVASWMLGVPVHDTQCGAKMFRVTAATRSWFEREFSSRWIFDVELLARLMSTPAVLAEGSIDDIVYELPLDCWRDVDGSKVTPRAFARAAWDLAGIYLLYSRPLAATRRAVEASRPAAPGLDVPTTAPRPRKAGDPMPRSKAA